MNYIKILSNGIALPNKKVDNKELNKIFNLEDDWIDLRTGIKARYYIEKEDITSLAVNATRDALKKVDIDIQKIGIIVVATTSTNKLMPGISYEVQKDLDIKKCMCMDILCGCSGYINGFDIVRKYIALRRS